MISASSVIRLMRAAAVAPPATPPTMRNFFLFAVMADKYLLPKRSLGRSVMVKE